MSERELYLRLWGLVRRWRAKVRDDKPGDWQFSPYETLAAELEAALAEPATGSTPQRCAECQEIKCMADCLCECHTRAASPSQPLGYCDRHKWLHVKDGGPSLPPHEFPCENWAAS